MCLEPDPPREVDRDHDRRGLDERPARAGRCDEGRGDEGGQREALALVLRQRAGAEEERCGRQQPRCAGAQPCGQARDAEGDEHRQRDVGRVRRQLVEEGRSGHDREQRAREQERVGEGAQERPRAADERDREAEQLQMEQGAVEASEEAEVDRFERRQQQRVLKGGIGRVGEDRRDRVAEVEQGPGTRPPDLPAVRLEQRLDGREPGRRDDEGGGDAEHRECGEAARRRPAEAQGRPCGQAPKPERQRARREHRQRDPADRHVDDREFGGEDPGRRQAHRVAERQPGEQVTPGPGEPKQRQQSAAEREHQHVGGDEREGAARHGALIRET